MEKWYQVDNKVHEASLSFLCSDMSNSQFGKW